MITETVDASVASERFQNSTVPPTDKHYRLTGERTEHKDESEDKPVVAESAPAEITPELDASAAPKPAVTSADSAPAQPQKKLDAAARLKQVLAEQKREREEWRQERERLASQPRETKQEAQPAKETTPKLVEPKIDDKDEQGQFKYKTLAEYNAAVRDYDRKQILAEVEDRTAKSAKEREQSQAKEAVNRNFQAKVGESRKKHDDFDAVALNPSLNVKEGSAVDLFILDSDHGAEILYELGANPAELDRINALHPLRQVRELTKMELKYSNPSAPAATPAKPVTAAARPPNQVSGKGTVAKDAIEQAVEDGDSEAYQREMNARDPRLKAVLARRKQG